VPNLIIKNFWQIKNSTFERSYLIEKKKHFHVCLDFKKKKRKRKRLKFITSRKKKVANLFDFMLVESIDKFPKSAKNYSLEITLYFPSTPRSQKENVVKIHVIMVI